MPLFNAETEKALKKLDALPVGIDEVEKLPTGIYSLDAALGGGLPKKRVTEIAGDNNWGKTSTALIIAQKTISNGGRVAWFNSEMVLDPFWMLMLGIPDEEVYWGEGNGNSKVATHFHTFEPEYLEQGLQHLREIAELDAYDLIVYDSIGGSPTRAAFEASIEDQQMTQMARVLSRFRAVIPGSLKKSHAACLLINQISDNINMKFIDPLMPYGGTLIPNGGRALKFLCSVRIFMYSPKKIEVDGEIIGKTHSGRIYKNRYANGAPIPAEFKFHLMSQPDYYLDVPLDILETSENLGVLEAKGRFWYFGGEQVAGSKQAMKERILDDLDLSVKVETALGQRIQDLRRTKEKLTSGRPETNTTPGDAQVLPGSEDDIEFQNESSPVLGG